MHTTFASFALSCSILCLRTAAFSLQAARALVAYKEMLLRPLDNPAAAQHLVRASPLVTLPKATGTFLHPVMAPAPHAQVFAAHVAPMVMAPAMVMAPPRVLPMSAPGLITPLHAPVQLPAPPDTAMEAPPAVPALAAAPTVARETDESGS